MGNLPLVRRSLIELYIDRYTETNMTATVDIVRGVTPGTTAVYTGRARIHRLTGSVQMGFGDEPQYMLSGTASVPILDADGNPVRPRVNDTLRVITHHDPTLVGRSFRIMHIDQAGQFNGVVSMTIMGAEDSPTTGPYAEARSGGVTKVPGTSHDFTVRPS